MQAVLNVQLHEIDQNLLTLIKELISKDVDVLIKKETLQFEEYDKRIPLANVVKEFAADGYSDAFLHDLEQGLASSSVYAKADED